MSTLPVLSTLDGFPEAFAKVPTARSNGRAARMSSLVVTTSSDEVLVSSYARNQDQDALGELVRRHWARSYTLALRALGDPGAADDAAQEAFVALVRGARRFDPSKPFGPWFMTLLMNSVRMSARSSRSRERREEEAARRRPGISFRRLAQAPLPTRPPPCAHPLLPRCPRRARRRSTRRARRLPSPARQQLFRQPGEASRSRSSSPPGPPFPTLAWRSMSRTTFPGMRARRRRSSCARSECVPWERPTGTASARSSPASSNPAT